MRTIAYFISSHGFGHGVRSCRIMKYLAFKFRVFVFTGLPVSFLRAELGTELNLIPCELDCGCVQKDAVRVDIKATLEKYRKMNLDRDRLIGDTAGLLKKCGAEVILADIPAMAFPAARLAGISGYGISNFNWVDIYTPYLNQYPEYLSMVTQMKQDYALCEKYFSLSPGLRGSGFTNFEETGMVYRTGRNKRAGIAKKFGIDAEKKWCLVYVGSFGLEGIRWDRLSGYPDWEFLGVYPLKGAADNYHCMQNLNYNYADLTASSDLILGKLGYGLLTECLCHAVPVIFFERLDFAEYPVLKRELYKRGQGIEISLHQLKEMNLRIELDTLTNRVFDPVRSKGEKDILKFLEIQLDS